MGVHRDGEERSASLSLSLSLPLLVFTYIKISLRSFILCQLTLPFLLLLRKLCCHFLCTPYLGKRDGGRDYQNTS